MMTQKMPKNAGHFFCENCDFKCSKESNFKIHLATRKHKMMTNDDTKMPENAKAYICECGKSYKYRQGLSVHKQKCTTKNVITVIDNDTPSDPTFEYLLKENLEMKRDNLEMKKDSLEMKQDSLEMKQMMMEMMGKMGNTITNNTQNNQFNINMFLNETCKDAINFSDFIDRIEISHDDLENNAQLGFVNGITKILMDNLGLLTINERPIHCTDVKRETLYIKEQNVWNKDQSVEILENAIKEVSRKSMQSLSQWKKSNPDYEDMDSEFSKKCIPMQQNSMGLCNKESFYPKIIHNIAKANSISHMK